MTAAKFALSLARRARSGALGCVLCACSPKLDLGSDVLWATDHESGTIKDWSKEPGTGGLLLDNANSTVVISDTFAHSGRYSLKFTDLAAKDEEGPCIFREERSPPPAYYSAWYYVPRQYQTLSQWTIQKFQSRSVTDPTVISQGFDLNLRALPPTSAASIGGQLVLYIYSHDPTYLQLPLANPPAFVPVGAWFQVETLYLNATDDTGRFLVWLNDRLVYDMESIHTAQSDDLLWSACDIAEAIDPAPPELYVDDAAISLSRVTRAGSPLVNP
jgi:hypothetical protein